jgi:2,3,4,5-tetrahydropyridine-2-carboxylate N-succinyltransferase
MQDLLDTYSAEAIQIETLWTERTQEAQTIDRIKAKALVQRILDLLDQGTLRVASKQAGEWVVHEWIKQAILLSFRLQENRIMGAQDALWFDKVSAKLSYWNHAQLEAGKFRAVPGAFIRYGAYLGKNVVVMPSFVNVGSYIDEGTMIDSCATVGSCAQIGKHCHIASGVVIGGVLEPMQARPAIIEDHCFIGANSAITEGVIVGEGAVLAMGVNLSQSSKIYDRATGKISYGTIPPYAVVVPGTLPSTDGSHTVNAAIIVKTVDAQTRSKTSINALLREAE